LVNADRVKRKLPSLLCDGPTSVKNKDNWAQRHRIENGLDRLMKHKPEKYHSLETRLIFILSEMERAALEK
jgi:hypothetical protein